MESMWLKLWLNDFLNVLMPLNCQVCGKLLTLAEQVICLHCEYKLPRTGFTFDPDNPVSQLFWGRTAILQATALFKFEKGSDYQVLLHNLKYRGMKKNAGYLGKLLGNELKNSVFSKCDLIIPVPLHKKKMRKRGYNQAELIAQGMASILKKPVIGDFLFRVTETESQTRKNRFERFVNMKSKFILNPVYKAYNIRSCLLVDDVVTTGSTLEACSEAIVAGREMQIYAVTVAFA